MTVEIFHDYDERAGNLENEIDLSEVTTTEELQALYTEAYEKQWIPLDPTLGEYERTSNEIVHDTAAFDSETFWQDYLSTYTGELSPVEKYADDLLSATGLDINSEAYQSTNLPATSDLEILPYKLPYDYGEGYNDGVLVAPYEQFESLPDSKRFQVNISVLDDAENAILSHSFFGTEINNAPVELKYKGADEDDAAIIESYGGIHSTPADLVSIAPYLTLDSNTYEADDEVDVAQDLELQFDYYYGDELLFTDEKASIAGNNEGIYISLSKVYESPFGGTNSEILLEGNAAMAWNYLKKVQDDAELLEKSFDYESKVEAIRAVVTQSREIVLDGDSPTTFDFSGLNLDASLHLSDYSKRGDYKTHRDDSRLISALNYSYYEGQFFDDLAGLGAVSTVQALQEAYAHPETYTVYTIDSSNESLIEDLDIPESVKQIMRDDVAEGNTHHHPRQSSLSWHLGGRRIHFIDRKQAGQLLNSRSEWSLY